MNYQTAQAELRRLVDDGLAAGSKGTLDLPKGEVHDYVCGESDEEQVYPEYRYHFPLEMLGPDPDSFATRVAEYWRSEDFELIADDADPGINGSYAENDNFHLHVFVNRITGKALIAGSGPCVKKPS